MQIHSIKNSRNGFSLPELLVAMVMFGILTTAGYSLFREQTRLNKSQQNILEMQSSGRAALQILIQSLSHAGFRVSYTTADFIDATYGDATSGISDSITVTYGTEYVGNITTDETDTDQISAYILPTKSLSSADSINFFPSLNPNKTYQVDNTPGTGATVVDIDEDIISLLKGAKIFRINSITYTHNATSGILYENNTPLIYDVASFQLAYIQDGKTADVSQTWKDKAGEINEEKIEGIWVYLLLRTREKEPRYKDNRTLTLPWGDKEDLSSTIMEDGFYYQEFQTQIWLRNAK